MKRYFWTGLVIFLPVAITLLLTLFVVNLLTDPFVYIVEKGLKFTEIPLFAPLLQNETALLITSRIVVLLLWCLFLIFLGLLGRFFLFKILLRLSQKLFLKIPFIKTVFRISKDVTKALLSSGKKPFKKTVLLPFPHQKASTLGLTTGSMLPEVMTHLDQKGADLGEVVFVPTSPHPISGFLVMMNQKELKEVDIKTEDLFKFLLSCGTYQPKESPDDT